MPGKQPPEPPVTHAYAAIAASSFLFFSEIPEYIRSQAAVDLAVSRHFVKPLHIAMVKDAAFPFGQFLILLRTAYKELRSLDVVICEQQDAIRRLTVPACAAGFR